MDKKYAAVITGLLITSMSFGQNIQGTYDGDFNPNVNQNEGVSYGNIRIAGNQYLFSIGGGYLVEREIPALFFEDTYYDEKGTYEISHNGKIDFLSLQTNTGYQYKSRLGVIFHSRKIFLYDNNNPFFIADDGLRWGGFNPAIRAVRSSSALSEGQVNYDGTNFIRPDRSLIRPWVESAQGDGIGEWIEITTEKIEFSLSFFLISNGYVSFSNPSLYERNNRIKKLRIECAAEGIDMTVDLADSYHFQEIRLPKPVDSDTAVFKFTIVEVYEGSQWEDTCLNLIVPMGDLPR